MLKSAEKTGTNEFTIALSIPGDVFEKAINKAYNKEKGNINLPGFRKGKAPRAMIEKVYGEGVFYDDALDIAFPEIYEAAIVEAGIEPVANPFDFDIKEIGKNGVELVCKVVVKPEITVEGYKELCAVKAAVEVTDEEIDADIAKKLEQNARIISVEDKAVENGNIAVIDFEGFTDGEAFEGGKAEEYELEIGSGSFIPGFEEQIIGHSIGDEFDVNVTFPEEYAENLAGKPAVFKIKLHAIKAKELPALDDDFVKDVSEFDTVDEYKADIRKTLEESKAKSAEASFKNEIYDKLSELVKEEIPEAMVDRAVENMVNEFKYNVESQGIPFEQYLSYLGMTVDSIKENYRERALKDTKIELALEKIAELEGVEITDEDVDAEMSAMAEKYGVDLDVVKKAVLPETVKKELKARKADEIIFANAKEEAPEKKKAAKKPAAKKTTKKKAEEETAPAEEASAE